MYATGVRNLVAFWHTPATVQRNIIDGIREQLQDGVADLTASSGTVERCVVFKKIHSLG
jgi:hypothetical protein